VATCLRVVLKSNYIVVSDAIPIKGNLSVAKYYSEMQMMA